MRHPSYVPKPPAPWEPARFKIGGPQIYEVAGWEIEGLGLDLRSSVLGRRPRKDGTRKLTTTWVATHLNTGHCVRMFRDVSTALVFPAALELATMTDWTFQGLEGWRNIDPALPDKLQAWHAKWKLGVLRGSLGLDEDVARTIGMSRW